MRSPKSPARTKALPPLVVYFIPYYQGVPVANGMLLSPRKWTCRAVRQYGYKCDEVVMYVPHLPAPVPPRSRKGGGRGK